MYLIFTIMYDIISGIISPINLKMNRVSLNLTCLLTKVYYIVRATFFKIKTILPINLYTPTNPHTHSLQ